MTLNETAHRQEIEQKSEEHRAEIVMQCLRHPDDDPDSFVPEVQSRYRREYRDITRRHFHPEGVRRIETSNKAASAEYSINRTDDGFTLSVDLRYHGYAGAGTPTMRYETREECVAAFLERARRFFAKEPDGCASQAHKKAWREMQGLLAGDGLFSFIEPDPLPPTE